MKKFALFSFYIMLGLFLAVIAIGYALPGKVHLERSVVINAPPEKIYAIVSDLQRAREWQPWFKLDPAMQVTIDGQAGVGQKLTWSSSHPQVGNGSQTTTEAVANQKVVAALDFGEMGKASAAVMLASEGAGTRVTWGFDSDLNGIIERWFGLMMDRMIGPDFEKGLAALKEYAERP